MSMTPRKSSMGCPVNWEHFYTHPQLSGRELALYIVEQSHLDQCEGSFDGPGNENSLSSTPLQVADTWTAHKHMRDNGDEEESPCICRKRVKLDLLPRVNAGPSLFTDPFIASHTSLQASRALRPMPLGAPPYFSGVMDRPHPVRVGKMLTSWNNRTDERREQTSFSSLHHLQTPRSYPHGVLKRPTSEQAEQQTQSLTKPEPSTLPIDKRTKQVRFAQRTTLVDVEDDVAVCKGHGMLAPVPRGHAPNLAHKARKVQDRRRQPPQYQDFRDRLYHYSAIIVHGRPFGPGMFNRIVERWVRDNRADAIATERENWQEERTQLRRLIEELQQRLAEDGSWEPV